MAVHWVADWAGSLVALTVSIAVADWAALLVA